MNQTPPENIHPEFHKMLGKADKEYLLGQRGIVVWLYGLSGSGKSTIANALERRLHGEGFLTQILDGDNIRSGLNRNLGFSDEDRLENIRRVAEVARLFSQAGIVTLTSFICPTKALRTLAREIIAPEPFVETYVKCTFETCEKRDVKGLYAKSKAGNLQQFTGKDSAFEDGDREADAILDTDANDLNHCVDQLHQHIHGFITKETKD